MRSKLFWKLLKLLNANGYFRNNAHRLKHIGSFFIQHPKHFDDHEGLFEEVEYKSFDEKTKKYLVKKKINKHFIEVEKRHLHLNAK